MSKSRILVLALSLSVGVGAMNAGLPAGTAERARASVTASPGALTVAEAPVSDTLDVVGSGFPWRWLGKVVKCTGRGILREYINRGAGSVEFLTCYLS